MFYSLKNTLSTILLCLIGLVTNSQTFNFKNYNTEQGLPQSQVLAIYQDHQGNMWFGTNSGGIGKYDGNKFITLSENEGLVNNVVYSIAQNHKNELLFGTTKGLSVYNGSTFKTYNEKQGLKSTFIFKVINADKKVWIGTMEGVYTLEDNIISHFDSDSVLNNSSVYSIFIDKNKNIWFATLQHGVVYYNITTKEFKHFNKANGLTYDFVFSISQKENGDILVGTQEGLNVINKDFKVFQFGDVNSNVNIAFSSILPSSGNIVFFGTHAQGVVSYDFNLNSRVSKYNIENGLTSNPIQCLYKDREGNLWIGTDGAGVYKYQNDKFIYYTKNNGFPENYVNSISQDKMGNYWVALRNSGLMKIDGKDITNYKLDNKHTDRIPDNDINSILPLDDGRVLFGTKDGLCIYENGNFKTITGENIRHKYILSLYQDSKKTIWIGTTEGLYKYKNSVITEVKSVNSFKQEGLQFLILSILEDKNGSIWVGTENGLIKCDNDNITLFNEKTNFISRRVSYGILDSKKNLWFGTEEGVFNYDYKNFTKISQKNGLSSSFVNFLQIDNNNRLLVGTNTGVDIIDLTDFYKSKISIKHFGKDDGLLSLESNYNACFKDNVGRILIGTINGLEIYNPKYDKKNTLEALTKIDQIKLFFGQEDVFKYAEAIDSSSSLPIHLELPFNKNHLTFKFIGVSLTAPEKVMYQFMLEGVDNDWTPPTYKNEATYSSLPPGKYKFMVKAMNNDGLWNKEPVIYEFEILAPWYKTWWFYTICVLVLIGGISLYNYVKTKKLIADKQKLERVVDERTKELREEKEKVEVINKEVTQQKSIIEHKNIEITDSIKYAKNIQEALLPNLNEIGNLFKNSFVLYMPKDIVSGDFYWFAKNGDTSFIAAVDCTGHGVPGAFMSIVGNTLLNEIVNAKKITKPGDILLELHKGVKIALHQSNKEFERRDGMDITLCAFTKGANVIEYAGANRPLWIYRKDKNYELEIIKATKFPIGGLELEENRIYQNHTIPVNEGDSVYLFSDGYADQFGGPKGKKFMLTNLQKTFLSNIDLPMQTQKQKLAEVFNNWRQDTEQIDDVLVIGIKI